MTRMPFIFLLSLAACRETDDVTVERAPATHVELRFEREPGELSFDLPDASWTRAEKAPARPFALRYESGARSIEIGFALSDDFEARERELAEFAARLASDGVVTARMTSDRERRRASLEATGPPGARVVTAEAFRLASMPSVYVTWSFSRPQDDGFDIRPFVMSLKLFRR